ncbi:unnamed protein product, partial [Rotaria sp. Silwood2]
MQEHLYTKTKSTESDLQIQTVQRYGKKGTAEDEPIFNYIRSTAYRRRSSVLSPIPKILEDIVIPDNLKFLENGYPFLIFNNPAPNRIITLCSPQALMDL